MPPVDDPPVIRRPGARPGPGRVRWPPGRVPGAHSLISGPARATGAECVTVRSGPAAGARGARRRCGGRRCSGGRPPGPPDHRQGHRPRWLGVHPPRRPPGPGPRTLCRDAERAGCQPREHEHGRQPRLPVAFPGGRAGQPITPGALVQQFRARRRGHPDLHRGVPPARLAGPALVVARALGYSLGTATCRVIAAGGTWHRYPATRTGS